MKRFNFLDVSLAIIREARFAFLFLWFVSMAIQQYDYAVLCAAVSLILVLLYWGIKKVYHK